MRGGVILRVTPTGYEPADDEAKAQHAKLIWGDLIAARIWRSRSLPMQRLYWGILSHVGEASEWETAERLHKHLKLRLGYFEPMSVGNTIVPVLDSTAFDMMTQDEFNAYFDQALRVICSEIIPGTDRAELINEVEAMLGP